MADEAPRIDIRMKPDDVMEIGRTLGFRPYVLIEVNEEDGELVFDIQTGGGVSQDQGELASVLGVIAESLGYEPEPQP